MNERIWELWKQATLDPTNEDSPDLVEKFAESIVRECMRMCDVAEASLLTHGVREQSYGAANARRFISDWFEIEE
jgi:hypothetical protein